MVGSGRTLNHTRTYTRTHIFTHTRTHKHTHTRTHTWHTYIYIYMYMRAGRWDPPVPPSNGWSPLPLRGVKGGREEVGRGGGAGGAGS